MTGIRPATLNTLRRTFDGTLITPGDHRYDSARQVWNVDIARTPALIARPATASAVGVAIRFARDNGLQVAVRGGGHGLAGFGTADEALVVDLQGLAGLQVDAGSRVVEVGAGARWGAMDTATQEHGLAVTGADAPQVGVGGTTLGGGLGWLHRLAGLTCDNLLEADLVTADGTLLTVSSAAHPDLFWAMRGGGGNFGVATRFRFRLHPVRELTGGVLLYPLEQGRDFLRHYQQVCADLPPEAALRVTLMKGPPAPFVPEGLRGKPVVMAGVFACGTPAEAARLLSPLREFGPATVDGVRPMSYLAVQQPPNRFPERQRAYGHSAFLGALSDAAIDVLVDAAGSLPSPLTMVQIQQLGGAVGELPVDATAVPFRHAAHHVAINALAEENDTGSDLVSWTRDAAAALRPHALGGPYVNFVTGEEAAGEIAEAFPPKEYARLTEIKTAYDPDNLFRFNANIRPV